MSNSPLVSYTRISPCKNPRNHKIDTITIHCVVGQASVEGLGETFANYNTQASSNYGIGADGRIGMYVEEKDRSWCSSSSSNDHRAITIECASDAYYPYAINDAVYGSLIDLLVDICIRNGIESLKWRADKSLIGCPEEQNMTVHRWFANKSCPGDYIYDRLYDIAAEVNERLEDYYMTQDTFNKMFDTAMARYRDQLRDNDASNWSEEARNWAVKNGLIAGSSDTEFNGMWEDYMTREQLVTVLYRFAELMGK